MGNRKCDCCGAILGDEDIMKIVFKDGSCEVIPISKCPKCFAKKLSENVGH